MAGDYWPDTISAVAKYAAQSAGGGEFVAATVVQRRFKEFIDDALLGLLPKSCRETLEFSGTRATPESLMRWIASEEGTRWIMAGFTKWRNANLDRGTILHLFKDALASGLYFSPGDVAAWLDDEIVSTCEAAKLTLREWEEFDSSEGWGRKRYGEWHDLYGHGKPSRSYDCIAQDVLPYLTTLNRWWQENAPECLWVERVLLNKRLRTIGTADSLESLNSHLWLTDYKTATTPGMKPHHAAQIGGYSLTDHYFDGTDVVGFEWPEVRGMVRVVTPERVYPYEVDLKKAQDLFRASLKIHRAQGLMSDAKTTRAKGGA